MTKKPAPPAAPPAIDRVREMLDYRLPQSRKPLGTIVLPREVATQLVAEWEALEARAKPSP